MKDPIKLINHLLNGWHLEPKELERAESVLSKLNKELESRKK